jgi:phage gpG-like protein
VYVSPVATGSRASVMADGLLIELQDQALRGALSRAAAKLEDPRELLDLIGGVLELNTRLRFETRIDPSGTPWLPLADSTRKRYKSKYKGSVPGSLLNRTGAMLRTLTHNVGSGFVDVGFTDRKAAWHETGTSRGLPRRAMLLGDFVSGALGREDEQDVLAEVERYLAALL